MAKYKCKQLGVCDKADAGEIFDLAPGADQKCPGCGVLLASLEAGKKTSIFSLPILVALGLVGAGVLGGAGYYLMAGRTKPVVPETSTVLVPPPQSQPTETPPTPPATTGGMAPTEAESQALRKESESKLSMGDAAAAEKASNRATANEMLKLAIAKMTQGKLDEAEKDLLAARERDPKQALISYNLAVLRLKQGRKDDAVKEFEASFMAGFDYFDQMDKDTDLDILRKDARFNDLVSYYRKKKTS